MLKPKKTKIVATLGPSVSDKESLRRLIQEGVNVFRMNFSHIGKERYPAIKEIVAIIRSLNDEMGVNVACLADLQGPKLRVGVMEENVHLKAHQTFIFTTEKLAKGNASKAFMTYQNFPKDVKQGETILVNDGNLEFEVIETDGLKNVHTKVIRGGVLSSNKGVNLPKTKLSLPTLNEKDLRDVQFAMSVCFDWIALSFVRNATDIIALRTILDAGICEDNFKIPIVAKIEKPEAIENIDEIIEATDAVMVARGDLGIEVPMHKVPLLQKKLVTKCKKAGIPVIIATQMMESMIENGIPTRAEVNDVANSILDGTDAVMLSGETATGKFPFKVVEYMRSIIKEVEEDDDIRTPRILDKEKGSKKELDRVIQDTLCYKSVLTAEEIEANAIITVTDNGYTGKKISSLRPRSHILVFSENKRLLTQMNLFWGVKAHYFEKKGNTYETILSINKIAREKGFIEKGDLVINLTSTPSKEKNKRANTIRITEIK